MNRAGHSQTNGGAGAFGSPLGAFRLTQKKLTEMAVMIEALRGLVYKSAWPIDVGRPDYHLAAMAKFYSGQTAVFCANNALQIHGGYGYIEEYPVQKWYREVKILEIYEGTKEAEIITIGRSLQRSTPFVSPAAQRQRSGRDALTDSLQQA